MTSEAMIEYGDCPECDATGEVPVKDQLETCPFCMGSKMIITSAHIIEVAE